MSNSLPDAQAIRHILERHWLGAAPDATERQRRERVLRELGLPCPDRPPPSDALRETIQQTERTEAHDLVGLADVRVGRMLDATPSCLKIVDRAGNLLYMNQRGLQLIEADGLESVQGANVYDLIAPDDRQRFESFNERVCAGASEYLRFEVIGLHGTKRWMDSWATPYELTDGGKAHLAISQDVSARILADQTVERQKAALHQAQRLAAVGEFAAGIGHEINNPLGIIGGLAGTVRMDLESDPQVAPELVEDLRMIEATVARISKITSGLKAFSRQETAEPHQQVQVAALVQQTVDLCSVRLEAQEIELHVEVDHSLEVQTNPIQIGQVLMNLLSNATQAVAQLPERWIRLRASRAPTSRIRFEVVDSGVLRDTEVISQMMNPFFTTKEVGEGTGLGLSISHALLESLGGALRFEEDAENTTFSFEIPERNP